MGFRIKLIANNILFASTYTSFSVLSKNNECGIVVFMNGKQSSSIRRKPHTHHHVDTYRYITVLSLERPPNTTGLLLDIIQVFAGAVIHRMTFGRITL